MDLNGLSKDVKCWLTMIGFDLLLMSISGALWGATGVLVVLFITAILGIIVAFGYFVSDK